MMELHCEICANAGGRQNTGAHSLLAIFDPDEVKLPLDGSMFKSSMPERGVPAPWNSGQSWDQMRCPRGGHAPWEIPLDNALMREMIDKGGPTRILTNRGIFALTDNGIEVEQFKHQETDEELEEAWFERVRESMSETDTEVEFMEELRKKGKSYAAIGRIIGKSKDTVRRQILGITRGKE